MGTRMKGIYKGFKYTLSQIFVVKEREIEIGYPTDVKHLAHIGWDGPSGNAAPSWMNEFKTGPDFAATSIGNSFSGPYPWSSQDFSESMREPSESDDAFENAAALSQLPNAAAAAAKKKQPKRKTKSKSTSSSSSSSLWSSQAAKPPKSNLLGGGGSSRAKTTDIVVS